MLYRQLSRKTDTPSYRIVVESSLAYRGRKLQNQLIELGYKSEALPKVLDLYFLEGQLTAGDVKNIAEKLICDPVTECYSWMQLNAAKHGKAAKGQNTSFIEVTLRPGVTDNIATELIKAAHRQGIEKLHAVTTGTRYEFNSCLDETEINQIAQALLVNATIQQYTTGEIWPEFLHPVEGATKAEIIALLTADEEELLAISQERRLALNLAEMLAVQNYFLTLGRAPTDAELETIAQTWSEHCVHKTFRANIQVKAENVEIDGLIKTYLQAATRTISAAWVRSAFVDNAGIIAFDDEFDISFKVETHNHPSAIEPFGGANTGVGGVVRDILGVSHRPVANTNVLCFGPQDQPAHDLPAGVLHPGRIKEGVVHGVEDYGNKLGLPTVNGAILYHPGYTANPLVYCGCVGIGPKDSHPRDPQPGDRVIIIGGKTGRDGIRGATFSSLTMDAQTGEVAGASVQIGDPITEKGVIEVVERARDEKLYNAITDCGAGGLSSAVGEMSENLGVKVDLATVPLKYPGLVPWEIWLSEAQERMVLAVPPENLPALQRLCDTYWVELSDIGEFQASGQLEVAFGENLIVKLDNDFLHHGVPRLNLQATLDISPVDSEDLINSGHESTMQSEADILLALLSHPNIASKEAVIRRYDHEVRGSTVIKPLVGPAHDGPSDACVMKPTNTKGYRGFVLANGINPFIGEIDAYNMAVSVIDEAIRNAVAVGGDPGQTAILDNFCWGDPNRPETMGSLLRAAQGCHDTAIHFQTPFISGKDSLNNEYIGDDGKRRAIPGTLLISSMSIMPDIRNSVSMDLKSPGDLIYLVGEWEPALGGSHAVLVTRDQEADIWQNNYFGPVEELRKTPKLSEPAPEIYRALHKAIHANLITAAHDLSEGGVAVSAAEMALAGRLGADLDLTKLHANVKIALFAETNGCLLVTINPGKAKAFETHFTDLPIMQIGKVTEAPAFTVTHQARNIFQVPVDKLVAAFTTQEE